MKTLLKTTIDMQPWKMLGWLLAIQILVAFVGRSLAPLGALIGADLALTKTQIGMLPAALFFGQALISIPAGFLTDRIGSRRMILVAAFSLGGGFILMAFTSVFMGMLCMIAIGGIGYGASHPASNRGIIYWFTTRDRGTAMGIKQMGVTVGSAFAALLLLPLASVWGWRTAVITASILLIVVSLVAYSFFHEPSSGAKTVSSNKPGRFFFEFAKMVKHKALVFISLGAMILNGSQMILNTYLVLFAYEKLGFSLFSSGVLLVVAEVGGSFGRVAWGVISDRFFNSKRIIIMLIISGLTAGISVLVATLSPGTPYWVMIPIALFFGFCISGYNGIWMNATTEIVDQDQAGIATGFSITVASWGVIIGPPLFGLIVDTSGTFAIGWLFVSGMMVVVALFLVVAMGIVKREG